MGAVGAPRREARPAHRRRDYPPVQRSVPDRAARARGASGAVGGRGRLRDRRGDVGARGCAAGSAGRLRRRDAGLVAGAPAGIRSLRPHALPHPLREEAPRRLAHLEGDLRRRARAGGGPGHVAQAGPPGSTRGPVEMGSEVVTVAVTSTSDAILVQDAAGIAGRVVEADVPVEAVAVCLRAGQDLSVSRPRGWRPDQGEAPCSVRGLLPSPWTLVAETLRDGKVVTGRVVAIQPRYALVEIVPGAKGIVGLAEVDHTFVQDIGDFLKVDDRGPDGQRSSFFGPCAGVRSRSRSCLRSCAPRTLSTESATATRTSRSCSPSWQRTPRARATSTTRVRRSRPRPPSRGRATSGSSASTASYAATRRTRPTSSA